jgi:hypothetical protein
VLIDALDEAFYTRLISAQTTFAFNFENAAAQTRNLSDFVFALRHNVALSDLSLKLKSKLNAPVLTDETCRELADSLKQLHSLTSLKLELFSCEQLTDESLKMLGNALAHTKELQALSLNINTAPNFTSTGFKDLSLAFTQLTRLSNLTIFLYNISNLTDDGLKHLGANIARLTELRNIKLDF